MLLLLFCCCTGQQLFAAQPQQPTYGSWHLPAPRSLCKHNVCLAEFTFTYTSASRAESQPDRKAAGTERSRSLHSVSPAGGKLGKKKKGKKAGGASQRSAGQKDCTRAEQTFHVAIQHAHSLRPPPSAGWAPAGITAQPGQTPPCKVLWALVTAMRRQRMPEKSQGLEDLLPVFSEKPLALLLREAHSEQKSVFGSRIFLCNILLPFCGLSRGRAELRAKSSLQ